VVGTSIQFKGFRAALRLLAPKLVQETTIQSPEGVWRIL
jgi:hypothetical protein